ncbi:MAG: tetraacyldisaccharide 4'-kinase [Prevotellaceae bacterium]|nr:tetraacyldisaccharide 4'-kinase [Prevotellaceae bacterium]
MSHSKNILHILLALPLAGLLWLVVNVRHLLYAWKIFKQHEFKTPVICVGNLAVGGTGKTPHVQMLLQLLSEQGVKVAVLSRGYKRKSKGFLYVETESMAAKVGDEPLQIKRRFPNVAVAVCKNRFYAIQRMKKEVAGLQAVILDDAFQYRRVKAGLSMVLTTFDNLVTKDYMLPLGRLRDSANQLSRAEMVIVTKCPHNLRPIDFNILEKDLKIRPYQHLYFTTYECGEYVHLSTGEAKKPETKSVIALAGIAHPKPFFKNLEKDFTLVQSITFPDHHHFGKRDVGRLQKALAAHPGSAIITTEKDAMRLAHTPMSSELRSAIYYHPINVEFLNNGKESFAKNTLSYVRENKRISHLY